jgi:hypothetical protein
VAAALAAAEQLLGACSTPVDAVQLQQARLQLEEMSSLVMPELQQQLEDAGVGSTVAAAAGLQPGRDYTAEVRWLWDTGGTIGHSLLQVVVDAAVRRCTVL